MLHKYNVGIGDSSAVPFEFLSRSDFYLARCRGKQVRSTYINFLGGKFLVFGTSFTSTFTLYVVFFYCCHIAEFCSLFQNDISVMSLINFACLSICLSYSFLVYQ